MPIAFQHHFANASSELTTLTNDGNYKVQLSWSPDVIQKNQNATLTFRVFDDRGNPIAVLYHLSILDERGQFVKDLFRGDHKTNSSGIATEVVNFDNMTSAKIRFRIDSVVVDLLEIVADFNMTIAPEFPTQNLMLVSIVTVSVAIAANRYLSSNRGAA